MLHDALSRHADPKVYLGSTSLAYVQHVAQVTYISIS